MVEHLHCRRLFMLPALGFAGGTIVFGGCGERPPGQGIVHPEQSRMIAAVDARSASVLRRDSATGPLMGAALYHLGEEEGPSESIFGAISDLAVDQNDRLVVLDARYHAIRLFDAEGRLTVSAGGPGGGPGEFLMPNAVGMDDLGHVFVSDARALRLSRFAPLGDSLVSDRTARLDVDPHDLCLLGDKVIVYGFSLKDRQNGGIVHVYNRELTHLASFGSLYASENPSILRALLRGHVACVPPDKVVVAPEGLPEVYGFGLEGHLSWVARIEEFTPFPYIESPGGMTSPIPEEGADYVASVVPASAGTVVVQVARVTPASLDERLPFAILDSYLISALSGEGAYLGTDVRLVGAVRGSRVIAYEQLPFPRLWIHQNGRQ